MILEIKILLAFLVLMDLSSLKQCDCQMWFKKLSTLDDGRITTLMYDKPPLISGLKVGTTVLDSLGPYGDIFIELIISDNDRIVCSRIARGDSALLPKVEKYLSKQMVSSAEGYGRKVFALYSFRLQFVEITEDKNKGRRSSKK